MNKSFWNKMAVSHPGFIATLLCLIPLSLPAQETGTANDTAAATPAPTVASVDLTPVLQANEELKDALSQQVETVNKKTYDKLISDIATLTTNLATRIDESKENVGKQIATISEENSQTTKKLNALMDRMSAMENKLSKEIIANGFTKRPLPQTEPKPDSDIYTIIAAVFALMASLIGLFLIWQNVHSKSGADPLLEAVSKSIKDLKKQVANVEISGDSGNSSKAYVAPPAPVDNGSSQKMETALKSLVQKLNSLENSIDELKESSLEQAQKQEAAAPATDPLWPWLVDSGNPLEGWKDRLLADMNQNRKPAFELYIALLEATQNLNSQNRVSQEKAGEIINNVATRLYEYLYDKEDLVTDDLIDLPTQWVKAMRTLTEPVVPSLEMKAVYPGDSLNSDTMDKIDGGSRLSIQKPYSWVISDKTNGTVRVLTRARVTTG